MANEKSQKIPSEKAENKFEPECIHFGIDYIRIVFGKSFSSVDLEGFFTGMSLNSNYREIDWYGYHFVLDYTYSTAKRSLKFAHNGFPILYLCHYDNMSAFGQRISYTIDIYSTPFYLPELQSFFSHFWRDIGFQGKITRLDLACDLLCTPKELLDSGYNTQFPKGAKYGYEEKTGNCETRYFGNKKSTNKRHLIRIYDKLKDSEEKGKRKIFAHYFQYPVVTRVEAEIRSTTCKNLRISPQKIADFDWLESVFRTLVVNRSATCFYALEHLNFAKASKLELERNITEVPMSRLQISRRFLSMAIGLHEDGADPIGFLIGKFAKLGVYQDSFSLKKLQQSVQNAESLSRRL